MERRRLVIFAVVSSDENKLRSKHPKAGLKNAVAALQAFIKRDDLPTQLLGIPPKRLIIQHRWRRRPARLREPGDGEKWHGAGRFDFLAVEHLWQIRPSKRGVLTFPKTVLFLPAL